MQIINVLLLRYIEDRLFVTPLLCQKKHMQPKGQNHTCGVTLHPHTWHCSNTWNTLSECLLSEFIFNNSKFSRDGYVLISFYNLYGLSAFGIVLAI